MFAASVILAVSILFAGWATSATKHPVDITNYSDCLLIAVTIVTIERHDDGNLKEMKLYFAQWMYPGDHAVVYFEEGKEYGVLMEAFEFDKDTRKATAMINSIYREGPYDPNKPKSDHIDLHCGHTIPKDV
jgi:hypothetical protein